MSIVLIYVIDTPRSSHPHTFIANMTYACSILYKNRLPLLLALNKIDIHGCEYAKSWIEDYEGTYTIFCFFIYLEWTYEPKASESTIPGG